ncbi:MAG: hypothetical protein ACRC68_05790, partial [Clostridium sp.]
MGESLLIKEYSVKENRDSLERYIEDAITKDFSLGNDLLFHYEFIRGNSKVYIYSIKKGVAVERVVIGARSISVTPI